MIINYPKIDPSGLLLKLKQAMISESQKHLTHDFKSFPKGGKVCSIDSCERTALVKGMCNAHYIRVKKGYDLSKPIESRKNPENCSECGDKTDAKSGWGRCTRCFKRYRKALLKKTCMDHLGGSCNSCGNTYPNRVMDFHYIQDKQEMVSFVLVNMSIEDIAKEVSKCILLCANCSRIAVGLKRARILNTLEIEIVDDPKNINLDRKDHLTNIIKDSLLYQSRKYEMNGFSKNENRSYICSHEGCNRPGCAGGYCNFHYIRKRAGKDLDAPYKTRIKNPICVECGGTYKSGGGWQRCGNCYSISRIRIIKQACVSFLGNKCSRCDKSYPNNVYDFHHRYGKDFSPSVIMNNNKAEVITSELMKCDLLCANCHRIEHIEEL